MGNLAGIAFFWSACTVGLFDTWLARILYGVYVGFCLWVFEGITPFVIIMITNLFLPFYLMAKSLMKTG